MENCTIACQGVYVEWLNRGQGLDYWLFSNTIENEDDYKSDKPIYSPVYNHVHDTKNTTNAGRSWVRKVTAVTYVGWQDYESFSDIFSTPLIKWWTGKKWVGVEVTNSKNKYISSDTVYRVEVTLLLPKRYTQKLTLE